MIKTLRLVSVAALLLLMFSFSAFAETVTVSGKVAVANEQTVLTTEDGKAYVLSGVDIQDGASVSVTGDATVGDDGVAKIAVTSAEVLAQ